jgi:outer membrane protein TolC
MKVKTLQKHLVVAPFMLFVVIAPSLYAQDKSEVKKLSLKESIEIALKGNPSVAMAEIDYEKASVLLDEARAANLLNASPISLKNAELSYKVAQENYELTKKRTILSVQSSYYNLLTAGEALGVSRKSLNLATENLRIAEDKFRLGSANELAVIGARAALARSTEDFIKAQSNYEKNRLTFLRNLQWDLATNLMLTDSEFPFEKWEANVGDLVKQALERRIEIVQAQTNIEIARLQVDLANNTYTPPTVLKKAQLDQAKAEVALNQQAKNISFDVQSFYLDLVGAESSVRTATESLRQSEENHRTLRINYEQGIVTKDQVDSAEISMLNGRNALRGAIFNYNNARLNLMIAVVSPSDEFLSRFGLKMADLGKGGN